MTLDENTEVSSFSRKQKRKLEKKKKLYKTVNFLEYILALFIIVVIVFFAGVFIDSIINKDGHPSFLGITPQAVLTGSMAPSIESGDMILTYPASIDKIKKGDIVSYEEEKNFVVTHRVIAIEKEDGQTVLKTKGDANNTEDSIVVTEDMLVGKYFLKIPKFGYLVTFSSTPLGVFTLFIIPVMLIFLTDPNGIVRKKYRDLVKK